MSKSGLFSKMKDARPGQGGLYFLANRGPNYKDGSTKDEFVPAHYRVKVKSVKAIETRKKEDMVIAECTIVSSDCAERKPGTSPAYVINMDQDAGPGNMMGFVMACMGLDPADDSAVSEFQAEAEEACDLAVSDDQPLAGRLVDLECFMTVTREKKNLFTVHRWSPVPEAEQGA